MGLARAAHVLPGVPGRENFSLTKIVPAARATCQAHPTNLGSSTVVYPLKESESTGMELPVKIVIKIIGRKFINHRVTLKKDQHSQVKRDSLVVGRELSDRSHGVSVESCFP